MHEQIVYQLELSENQSLAKILKLKADKLMQGSIPKRFINKDAATKEVRALRKANKKIISIPGFQREVKAGMGSSKDVVLPVPTFIYLAFMDLQIGVGDRDDTSDFQKITAAQMEKVIKKLRSNSELFSSQLSEKREITLQDMLTFFEEAIATSNEDLLDEIGTSVLISAQKMFLELIFKDDENFVEALRTEFNKS